MSKPKLTSLLFLGFIGRIAETLTSFLMLLYNCLMIHMLNALDSLVWFFVYLIKF